MKKIKNKRWLYLREIYPLLRTDRSAAILMIVLKICIISIMIVSPLVYRYFIDHVIVEKKLSNLFVVIAGLIGLFLIQSIFDILYTYYDNKLKNILRISLKKKLLYFYSNVCIEKYEKMNQGDIRNVIEEDTIKIQELYSDTVNYVFSILTVIVFIIVMAAMDWRLTSFGIVMIIWSFFLTQYVGEKIKKVSSQYRKGFGELENAIHHLLLNWKEIKMNNLEDLAETEVALKWQEISEFTIKRALYQYIAIALSVVNLMMITRTSIYFFGGILIFNNMATVSTMLTFMKYYQVLNTQMTNITDLIVKFKGDEVQIGKIIAILKQKIIYRPVIQPDGDIVLENVSFSYAGSSDAILNNISLTIPQNSHVAIVGKSGCGKSTLAKLLLGLLQPSDGKIFIGNSDINKIGESGLVQTISAVMQDPQFFNITIGENLRIAKSNVTNLEIDSVCRQANIYDFIQNLPEKYNTIIGERGIKLSGGQRQRLAIARIMLMNPQMIIFDEATSSLDTENENSIIRAIQNISNGKTIITIAHRFATIMESDYIFMLQDGMLGVHGPTKKMIFENEDIKKLFRL